jgi:hypothetical protein
VGGVYSMHAEMRIAYKFLIRKHEGKRFVSIAGFSLWQPGFNHMSSPVGSVVIKVALERVLSKYSGFLPQNLIPPAAPIFINHDIIDIIKLRTDSIINN